MRVALAGGGSGGHLYPGLALASALVPPGNRPVLYGSDRAAEREWVGRRAHAVVMDSPLLPARSRDVPGFFARLSRAVMRSLRDMQRRRPDLVVGLGGYASVAPGIAALVSHRPLLLLEQNVVLGKANRLLARLGGRVAATFPESLDLLPRCARERARVVGNPVRPELLAGRRVPERYGLRADRPVLLVAGGSQGAQGLNERVSACAELFARHEVQVIHLAGERDEERVRRRYLDHGVRTHTVAFSHEMGNLYRTADLVLCRAGGTTLAELTFLGRPSVLVPYPHHADRHQERNARVLASEGAARLVPESELDRERMEREVLDLIEDRQELGRMGRAALELAVPDAACRAASWARELMEVRT